jgi:PRD1 phage membrane DNA delivery
MGNISGVVMAVIGSFVGLAVVAVVVSKQAQAPAVIQAGGTALSAIIGAAVAPVAGNTSASTFGNAATSALGSLG